MKENGKIAIIGSGVIGASWAALFLARGHDVCAYDIAPAAEAGLRAAVESHWKVLGELGLAEGAATDRLSFTCDLEEALKGAVFVQENGPEDMTLKTALFQEMDALCAPEVILATSSSGLPISPIQAACAHGERIVTAHPFNPPHLVPLVEIVRGDGATDAVVDQALTFFRALGKHPIVLRKEVPGHIANRLQAALWREAFHLVATGVASVADIDTAISQGPGLRWALVGPFMNLQLSGGEQGISHNLHHLGHAIESWWEDLGQSPITPELIATFQAGVDGIMGEMTNRQVDQARSDALLKLLKIKRDSDLPEG